MAEQGPPPPFPLTFGQVNGNPEFMGPPPPNPPILRQSFAVGDSDWKTIDYKSQVNNLIRENNLEEDEKGRLPFFYITKPSLLSEILDKTSNPFHTDHEGNTFFHYLIINPHVNGTQVLELIKEFVNFVKTKEYQKHQSQSLTTNLSKFLA